MNLGSSINNSYYIINIITLSPEVIYPLTCVLIYKTGSAFPSDASRNSNEPFQNQMALRGDGLGLNNSPRMKHLPTHSLWLSWWAQEVAVSTIPILQIWKLRLTEPELQLSSV